MQSVCQIHLKLDEFICLPHRRLCDVITVHTYIAMMMLKQYIMQLWFTFTFRAFNRRFCLNTTCHRQPIFFRGGRECFAGSRWSSHSNQGEVILLYWSHYGSQITSIRLSWSYCNQITLSLNELSVDLTVRASVFAVSLFAWAAAEVKGHKTPGINKAREATDEMKRGESLKSLESSDGPDHSSYSNLLSQNVRLLDKRQNHFLSTWWLFPVWCKQRTTHDCLSVCYWLSHPGHKSHL